MCLKSVVLKRTLTLTRARGAGLGIVHGITHGNVHGNLKSCQADVSRFIALTRFRRLLWLVLFSFVPYLYRRCRPADTAADTAAHTAQGEKDATYIQVKDYPYQILLK